MRSSQVELGRSLQSKGLSQLIDIAPNVCLHSSVGLLLASFEIVGPMCFEMFEKFCGKQASHFHLIALNVGVATS